MRRAVVDSWATQLIPFRKTIFDCTAWPLLPAQKASPALKKTCSGNRETHLPTALQLEEKEEWNQSARDWKRLLTLSPDGCFGAFCGEKLIGTVTVMTYGQHLAWIGMMIVAKENRGRGIGKQLMLVALDYCESEYRDRKA